MILVLIFKSASTNGDDDCFDKGDDDVQEHHNNDDDDDNDVECIAIMMMLPQELDKRSGPGERSADLEEVGCYGSGSRW